MYHVFHQDEQGSNAYITGQGVENCYRYDAFGNLKEKRESFENRILYTGQQYDQETGQYYLRARYYNPVVGRFLQEDTYRGDGLNLYAYCANNPVIYFDPSGHKQNEYNKKQNPAEKVPGESVCNPKQTGSYTIEFESGKKYHGKGSESRMNQSAKYRAEKHNDKVKSKDWTPADNDIDAFIDEYFRMERDGGYRSDNNYSIRQSPGKKYYEKKKK